MSCLISQCDHCHRLNATEHNDAGIPLVCCREMAADLDREAACDAALGESPLWDDGWFADAVAAFEPAWRASLRGEEA